MTPRRQNFSAQADSDFEALGGVRRAHYFFTSFTSLENFGPSPSLLRSRALRQWLIATLGRIRTHRLPPRTTVNVATMSRKTPKTKQGENHAGDAIPKRRAGRDARGRYAPTEANGAGVLNQPPTPVGDGDRPQPDGTRVPSLATPDRGEDHHVAPVPHAPGSEARAASALARWPTPGEAQAAGRAGTAAAPVARALPVGSDEVQVHPGSDSSSDSSLSPDENDDEGEPRQGGEAARPGI